MSVRKKFESQKPDKDVDVDALIDKGAKVKEDQIIETNKWFFLNLRMPVDMLNEVNKAVASRIGISRIGWILEAIHEKLGRQ